MPQFLKTRYNESVSVIMAVFWLFLYVFVNLTSILFLGSVAISGLVGTQYFHLILIILAAFAIVITLGGMKVIGYTDVIQVIVLIIGGLVTVFIALDKVSGGNGVWSGFSKILNAAPDHFHLILSKPDAASTQEYINKYLMLPGILMYAAGQWIANLNYWGCNQYITQRALGADLPTARKGLVFAAFLKILMPIIVMLPGIAAFVLVQQGDIAPLAKQDDAYASVLGFLPEGLKGLSVAALTAAIVASLAGKANSISTIFTLDIYKKYIARDADERKLVLTGRMVVLVSMIIAIFFTWEDLLGIGGEGGFTFIQKYTGFISPGVFAMFLLGLFWKRTTGAAAVAGLLTGFGLSVFFNEFAPQVLGNETFLYTAFPNGKGGFEIPFLIAMGLAFLFAVLVMVVISLAGPKDNPKAFALDKQMFKISPSLMALITVVLMLIAALYIKFW